MKQTFKNCKFILVLFTILIFLKTSSAETYYSQGNLPVNLSSSWSTEPSGGGSNPNFTASGNIYIIQYGDTMYTTGAMNFSGANLRLQIDSGGVLNPVYNILINPSSAFAIKGGGLYIHNTTTIGVFGGTELFAKTGTVEFRNWPANFTQNITWGNLRFNATGSVTNNLNFAGNLQQVQGNFEILATGSPIQREIMVTTSTNYFSIGGNFLMSGGILNLAYQGFEVNIGGNLTHTAGTIKNTGYNIYIAFNASNIIFNQTAAAIVSGRIDWWIEKNTILSFVNSFNIGAYQTLGILGTLNCGTDSLYGTGTLHLYDNSKFICGSPEGINGNVKVSSFSSDYITYEFNGNTPQVTGTRMPASLTHTIISNTSGPVTLSQSTNFRGRLTINQSAVLDIGNFNITGGDTSRFLGTGTLKLNGNIAEQVSGFNINTFKNTGTFEFAGASQIVPSGTYSKLKVNGSGVTINGNVNVNDTLFLQSGNISLGAYNLTAEKVIGGSASSYVVTNGAVGLKINNVSGPVLFPVGRTSYNPVIIDNTGGVPDNFTVNVQNTIDNPTFNDEHAVQRQWNISEEVAGGSDVDITFQWQTAEEGTLFNRNSGSLLGGHWNGAFYQTFPAMIGGANDVWTATITGQSEFSPFIITDDVALPVEFGSFTSAVNGNNVKLQWSTVSEVNNSGFEIERNSFGAEWNKIGFLAGKGTTNTPQSYSFADNGLNTGRYSYRLKQIDYNGNYKYYELQNELVIGVPVKFALMQNYPNPFNPSTIINYQLAINSFVSLKIYDISGREVKQLVNTIQPAGYYTVSFDAKNLSSGMYFYSLKAGEYSSVKKMVLVK